MICGLMTELYLWLGTQVPWTWWVLIGTGVTSGVGWITSGLAPQAPAERDLASSSDRT